MTRIKENDIFGLLKPAVDVHTLGIATVKTLLQHSGYRVVMAQPEVMEAAGDLRKVGNSNLLAKWIRDNGITVLSYSYRLDPRDGEHYFNTLMSKLRETRCLESEGGTVRMVTFAGLPDTCDIIRSQHGDSVVCFPGDESPEATLSKYGIPEERFPESFTGVHEYDRSLTDFATKYVASERYRLVEAPDHYGYGTCGTPRDTYLARLEYCREKGTLPLIRVHAGPYSPNRLDSVRQYISWCRDLASSRLLDVLSIGSSQLTQSNFGENWEGKPNGGGVPVNSEVEYREIAEAARPMLVRTYAGTKDVPWMAQMHERTLNISWHALSFWWFCELDGRGANTVLENLREHVEAIKYIAGTGKPLEPNVPHHFSFRGGDDVTYIVSGYLAAKTAKRYGIRHLILQNMLNTPKYTWGIEDIAKGRAMLRLVRSLEDADFKVSLQTRAGLDYFAPDLEKAKVQLAAITAMMDDIEPENPNSPEIIHVVSYSEAVRLATPDVIKDSIRITRGALAEYRALKRAGRTYDCVHNREIEERYERLYGEAREAIDFLEQRYPDLYTPEGLYEVFRSGYLPVPYILDAAGKYPDAKRWSTEVVDGAVRVVDEKGKPLDTLERYRRIADKVAPLK